MDGFAEGENEEEKGEIVLEKPDRQVEINVIGFDEGKETNDVGVNENALSEYRLVFLEDLRNAGAPSAKADGK